MVQCQPKVVHWNRLLCLDSDLIDEGFTMSVWCKIPLLYFLLIPLQVLSDDCPICMCRFSHRFGKELDCGHSFHVVCIDRWLNSHINCPLCRFVDKKTVLKHHLEIEMKIAEWKQMTQIDDETAEEIRRARNLQQQMLEELGSVRHE